MRLLRRPQPDAGAQPCSQPTHAQQVLLSPAAEDADGLRVRRKSVNKDLEIVGWAPGFLSIRFTYAVAHKAARYLQQEPTLP
jgi:hypothetical protein